MSNYFLRENKRTGRDNVVIEDAKLIWKNFSGEESRFNRAGDRKFNVVIDDLDFADDLKRLGWNVKEHEARDEGDDPFFTLECAVSYKVRPPKICLYSGHSKTQITEETVGTLDFADIETADLVLNGSAWEVNGNHGIKAYVDELHVTIEQSAFGDKYDHYN